MSGAGGEKPRPIAPWNLDVEPGDPVDLFGLGYFFERVDSDGTVTFRPPAGAGYEDFEVVGENGRGRKPTMDEIGVLMAANDCIWREKPLGAEARRYARAQEYDAEQAREMDSKSPFRTAISRRYDANPWSRSDFGLKAFMTHALADPAIAALEGAWAASPATVRTWLNERGTAGCRKARDGISMKNRMPKLRRIAHPLEIVFYHAVRAMNVRGSVKRNYETYVAEIAKINAGQKLDRNFWIDPDGDAEPCARPAVYAIPPIAYQEINYIKFWRLCHELQSAKAYGRKTTAQGEYQKYGGGGRGDLPSHLGALCWMDATPVPKALFVDDETGIVVGLVTLILLMEHKSRAIVGWDLSLGGPSSSSVLRTVLSANQRKTVPADLLAEDSNLPWMRIKPDVIRFDNPTEHHARTVEDNLGDAYIGTDFVGSKMPRDKNANERVMGTFLDLLFKEEPGANYDIARMRRYGVTVEQEGLKVYSLRTARRLLDRAAFTYNMTRHTALMGRQPALVWKQSLGTRKLNVIKDVDKFEASIGTVKFLKLRASGIDFLNRHYTAGAVGMKRIYQDFERALRVRTGDTAPKPVKSTDDRKPHGFDVKIKYSEGDLGFIRVWNPHAEPACWEDLECTDPAAHGLAKWFDDACRELAEREAMEYLTPQGQAVVRTRLFSEASKVDSNSAERERQLLGRTLDDPNTRRVMGGYVHVADEIVEQPADVPPEEHTPAGHDLAIGARKDAHIKTPRPRRPKNKEPVAMQPSASSQDHGDAQAERAAAAGATTPPRRRVPRNSTRDDAHRSAAAHTKSAEQPDQRAPKRARSNRLTWKDEI